MITLQFWVDEDEPTITEIFNRKFQRSNHLASHRTASGRHSGGIHGLFLRLCMAPVGEHGSSRVPDSTLRIDARKPIEQQVELLMSTGWFPRWKRCSIRSPREASHFKEQAAASVCTAERADTLVERGPAERRNHQHRVRTRPLAMDTRTSNYGKHKRIFQRDPATCRGARGRHGNPLGYPTHILAGGHAASKRAPKSASSHATSAELALAQRYHRLLASLSSLRERSQRGAHPRGCHRQRDFSHACIFILARSTDVKSERASIVNELCVTQRESTNEARRAER